MADTVDGLGGAGGGGDTVDFANGAGHVASLGDADKVNGSNGTLGVTNARVSLNGAGALGFQAHFRLDAIKGLARGDVSPFAAADQGPLTIAKSSANPSTSRDANDVLTLTNILPSAANASRLHFV